MVVVVPSKQAMTESPRPAAATLDVAGNTATTNNNNPAHTTTNNNNNPAHTNNNNNNTPPTSTHKARQYPPHYNNTTTSGGGRNHHNGYYNNNRSHYHGGHNSHYHHCTFPTPVINALANGVIDVNGVGQQQQQQQPARFCFGPGFEPQQNGFRGGYGVRGHSRGCAAGAAVAAASAAAAATSGQSVGGVGGGAESHVVLFHVNPGVTIRFQIGDSLEVLRGPVTVPMVSTNSSPPIAMPVQVPLGHVVQQIVDERGTLRHVILSPQHPANLVPMPPHQHYGDGSTNNNTNNPPPYGHPYSGNGGGVPPPASSISPNSGGGVGGLPGGYTHPHHHHHQSQPPPPLYHTNMAPPPGGGGGGQPQQQHGSPTPGYYRDERAQRQFIKLRKKLHQRKGGGGGAVAMGNSTVRDTGGNSNSNVNTRIRKAPPSGGVVVTSLVKEKGMNSVGTSEDGEESSSVQDDEDSISLVTDMLSSVQAPTVSELSSRCALLQWSVPPAILDPTLITSSPSYTTTHSSSSSSTTNNTPANNPDLDINPAELRYEVLLNAAGTDRDRGRCCYKSIYSGAALSCRIQDLRPGQEYAVCLQVHLDDELQGTASDPVRFTTPPCEPDQPHAPSLLQRKRNTLQLRWGGAAVNDNGSHIQHYILEVDDTSNPSTAGTFTEAHRGKGKQYTLQKLQAATTYRFRLAAVNECGTSAYSDIVAYTTMENAPPAPKPPLLAEATVHTLLLHWERGVADRRYTLEMAEAEDGGYLPRYNGDSTEYKCDQLLTCTEYRFRLLAGNDGGNSPWSEEVRYCTRPDQPSRPSKPVVKGRINAHSFRLCWEPPSNTGGTTISKYILEVNSGSGYETIYNGPLTEATCDRLTPGTTYQLRVSCLSSGGQSDHSDPCTVTTDAICPGQCPPPVVTTPAATAGRVAPAARYVTLRLTPPDYNGGAPVLEYEVQLTGGGRNAEVVYKRKEMECMIVDLLPGTQYSFLVRGVNRIGAGVWSEPLTITTASIPPEPPTELTVTARTAHHVFVEWSDSECYGSPITEYRLEMFTQQQFEEGSSANATTVYQGPAKSHDLKSLTPDTTYHLRCSAANTLGYSSPCPPVPITTPPSAPGCPSPPRVTPTPRSLHVTWTAPPAHGSPITHYQLDFVGDNHPQTFTIPVATATTVEDDTAAPLEFLLEDLTPETVYKVRVQAHNGIGAGVYSGSARVSTLTPPPKPPRLECVQVSHNYVKMRWGGESVGSGGAAAKRGSSEELFTTYHLELLSPFAPHEYQCVFKGTQKTFKVNKLQEAVCYTFRICASNDAGGCGDYSDELEVNTSIAPPVGLRVPKLVETDVEQRCCTIEWQTSRNVANDETSYLVQVTKAREQDYKEVYKGSATKHTLTHLDPSTEYLARVCPIRLCATASGELPGPFSPPLSINLTANIATTSKSSSNNTLSSGSHNNGTTTTSSSNPHQRHQQVANLSSTSSATRSHHHHHHRASNKSTSVRLREWVRTTAETYKVMLISLLVVVVSCGLAMVLYTPAE